MRDLTTMRSISPGWNRPAKRAGLDALVGESSAMRELVARLRRIAARDTTLLLEGESGTGKELAAQAVHETSPRRNGPFVVVDCRANPRGFADDDLFDSARGGTVFLDEIGELDLTLQPRLLRLVENGPMRLVGARVPHNADFRIIAATSRDLGRETAQGAFRSDLYYRLAVNCVRLPPLAERLDDIPLLWRHFCEELNGGGPVDYALDGESMKLLMQRSWPGNVRELFNTIERVATFGPEGLNRPSLEPATATATPTVAPPPVIPTPMSAAPEAVSFHNAKAKLVASFERDFLTKVLARHHGNITAAANTAGLDRVHFLRLLDRHGLRKPRG